MDAAQALQSMQGSGPNSALVLFYPAAHTGVLFDWVAGRQKLLQGHCNAITSTCISRERRWIATADKGPNSMVIVWDLKPGLARPDLTKGSSPSVLYENDGTLQVMPIKNIYDPHGGSGVLCLEFTSDSRYIITLGSDLEQTICIWDWTAESNEPIATHRVQGEPQICLRLNSSDPFEFLTNGPSSVSFYVWDREQLSVEQHIPMLSAKDFKHVPSGYTHSTFIPSLGQAASGTCDGDVIVWTDRSLDNLNLKLGRGQKAAIKFVKLHTSAINFITTVQDKFILTGGADGFVKVFDMNFRILFWCERLFAGPVSSVTFSMLSEPMFDDVAIPELIVATKHSRILLLHHPSSSSMSPFRPGTAGIDAVSTVMTAATPAAQTPALVSRRERDNMEMAGIPGITNLLYGQYGHIRGLATHPEQSRFAVGGDSGHLQIWDYSNKQIVVSRHFEDYPAAVVGDPANAGAAKKTKQSEGDHGATEKAAEVSDNAASSSGTSSSGVGVGPKKRTVDPTPMRIHCIAYSNSGKTLAIGFHNGIIRLLDAFTLEDLPQSFLIRGEFYGHQISHRPILRIAFSPDGDFCVAADADNVICVLRKEAVKVKLGSAGGAGNDNRSSLGSAGSSMHRLKMAMVEEEPQGTVKAVRHRIEWVFIGRRKTHFKEIIVSKDRHIADYDLTTSSLLGGITTIRRIEQIYKPEAAVLFHKHHVVHPEQFILTFNSGYKLKQFTASTQLCRKTVLAPTFGGHINNLCAIPSPIETRYMAFSTSNQVIGITKMPLEGNPYTTMGIIAHPGSVSNIVCAHNGTSLITAGGADSIVNMWTISPHVLEAQAQLGGSGLDPYLNMLDPSGRGEESPIYKEFEDYFYYAQLRSQGEDVAESRMISDVVSLKQVPSIMQAMGFYPTNQEIDDMINEVKYSRFAQGEGEEVSSITFGDLIKLYLNHKPVRDVSIEDLEIALSHAKRLEPGKPLPTGPVRKLALRNVISSEGVVALLQQYGESFSLEDAHEAFHELLIEQPPYFGRLPRKFTTKEFIEGILGMAPAEEGQADGRDAAAAAQHEGGVGGAAP
ncbi:hypothetical protein HK105_208058 [Polyrhizophydium stewartii]|uniref:Cilia- and flagella-associated protein 251 n=1 Tax=Polyrhizophydium stewartii TaxID=2732419 RepID=A0ABR4MYY5_9FUNG